MNIYMCRHGQNIDNVNGVLNGHRDLPLSEKGIEQANEIADKIVKTGLKFDTVYSSPLDRAKKTADIICSKTKSPSPIIMNLLIERDFGDMSGVEQSRISDYYSGEILMGGDVPYILEPNNGETFPESVKRANTMLEEVKRKHNEGNILLVTHGDIGKMIYCAYYNLDWKEVLKQFHFGNGDLLLMSRNSSPEDAKVFELKQYNI